MHIPNRLAVYESLNTDHVLDALLDAYVVTDRGGQRFTCETECLKRFSPSAAWASCPARRCVPCTAVDTLGGTRGGRRVGLPLRDAAMGLWVYGTTRAVSCRALGQSSPGGLSMPGGVETDRPDGWTAGRSGRRHGGRWGGAGGPCV